MSNVIRLRKSYVSHADEFSLAIMRRIGAKHWVTVKEILGEGREKYIVKARDEAILCVKRETGFSSKRLAIIFGKECSSIRHSIRRTRNRELSRQKLDH